MYKFKRQKFLVLAMMLTWQSPLVYAGDLPVTEAGTATAGLIQISTTGNPEGLHGELGGHIEESSIMAETIGQGTLDSLLDVANDEHLAPMALIAPNGDIFVMVAPTITKDNFIWMSGDTVSRMDVGHSEGTNEPFLITEIPLSAESDEASAGLIQLSTTGNPEGLYEELGGEIKESAIVSEKVGEDALNALLDVDQDEHLAPMALVTPSGEIYAMVAPTITKDNFIFVSTEGVAKRMDVGFSEGTNVPFQVNKIVSDGGTPWYVEFWYWLTGQ